MIANIIKLSVFVLNIVIAAYFLYTSVNSMRPSDIKSKVIVGAAAFAVLYHVYNMYMNTKEMQDIGNKVKEVASDIVDGAADVVEEAKEGINKTV